VPTTPNCPCQSGQPQTLKHSFSSVFARQSLYSDGYFPFEYTVLGRQHLCSPSDNCRPVSYGWYCGLIDAPYHSGFFIANGEVCTVGSICYQLGSLLSVVLGNFWRQESRTVRHPPNQTRAFMVEYQDKRQTRPTFTRKRYSNIYFR